MKWDDVEENMITDDTVEGETIEAETEVETRRAAQGAIGNGEERADGEMVQC